MNSLYEKYGLKPCGAVPNERQLEWYGREKTIFFHFGMNTFTGREWGDGTESPSLFNPTELDVEQWIKTIKDGGFTTAILTAKHHDGFCLWQTKYTEHSVKNSPYKNGQGDIVREFTEACQKHGIKAGIYLSPWDRHEKTWGSPEYNDFYVGQLTELLTNYGKIWECWWDGAGSTEAVYDWERWAKTVRSLQPDAVIFGSLGATPWVDVRWVGNEKGIAGKPCYATIDPYSLVVENTKELNRGKLGGERFIPAEVDVSIRPGWFYHSEQDGQVRTPENLIELWFTSIGSNAGLLLNLPPDKRGLIHENDALAVRKFNEILNRTLSNNLAENAKITGKHTSDCVAQNLLEKGGLYIPESKETIVEINLGKPKKFNTFIIGEDIEYGHRVTKIKVNALVNGEHITLFERDMIGNKLAERFDTVVSDKLTIEICALDLPILKDFGIYLFESSLGQKAKVDKTKNILDSTVASVDYGIKEIDVNLGGIIPFNLIKAKNVGDVSFKLYVFNGSAFELLEEGESNMGSVECCLSTTVDTAYRFKLTFDKEINENAKIEVFNT